MPMEKNAFGIVNEFLLVVGGPTDYKSVIGQ
jgi:hypothetical protein